MKGPMVCCALLGAPLATHALDWQEPWLEPHSATAAARRSDEYAWRLFVALNWPADPKGGSADRTVPLGTDGPVVWETWQNAEDVYREDGADPGQWPSGPPAPREASVRRFETLSLKDFPNARHIVNGVMVPLLDPLADAGRLTEIRLNRTIFNYIRTRELFNVEGQLRAVANGNKVAFPYGSREVKAMWRAIGAAERDRYHTLTVTLADGSRRLYGLTALHIASKDLPTWFWATFEHVDNPSLPDGEGWRLPSRDAFACRSGAADCNRPPRNVGLEGTVWRFYRLRGTLTSFVDPAGAPRRLANSQLESGFQETSSCITCHARASIGSRAGTVLRLPVFASAPQASANGFEVRHGFTGLPQADWFAAAGARRAQIRPLDFVWSLSKAHARRTSGRLPDAALSNAGESGSGR